MTFWPVNFPTLLTIFQCHKGALIYIQLSQSTLEWQSKVRQFVDQELIPWEVEAELNNGIIPPK